MKLPSGYSVTVIVTTIQKLKLLSQELTTQNEHKSRGGVSQGEEGCEWMGEGDGAWE